MLFVITARASGQVSEVTGRIKTFHQFLVQVNSEISSMVHDDLTYGHSNGWIENKKEFLSNLGDYLVYHSFKEDSVNVIVSGDIAHARFIAEVDVSLNGKRAPYKLRVLEVWMRTGNSWKLYARQAVKYL